VGITDDGLDLDHEDLYQNVWINNDEIPASRFDSLLDLSGDGYFSMEELNSPLNRGPFKANDVDGDSRITARDLIAPMIKDALGADTGGGGFADGLDQGSNSYVDDVCGWDFWNNDNDPSPNATGTHGTHVTGILAARTNNATGVAGIAGRATIMPIRFYANLGGTWTSSIVADAYAYAADNGSRILSTSYNVDGFVGDNIFTAALQYMYDRGVLHFNSAGNSAAANPARQNLDHSLYVVNTDEQDQKYWTSNWGWGLDLAAPGTNIFSTYPNNTYGSNTGTSMSTPAAAAAAALLWSLHPNWTRQQVAAQLWGTARNIDALNPDHAGLLGAGRIDTFAAVSQSLPAPRVRSMSGLPASGGTMPTLPATFRLDVASIFDAATITPAAFELRGDGPDDIFGTSDDFLIPLAISFGGSQSPAIYDRDQPREFHRSRRLVPRRPLSLQHASRRSRPVRTAPGRQRRRHRRRRLLANVHAHRRPQSLSHHAGCLWGRHRRELRQP
jgi:subtilisin family serine protease